MMAKAAIRAAEPSDVNDIWQLMLDAFEESDGGYPEPDQNASYAHMLASMADNRAYVGTVNGDIVAYMELVVHAHNFAPKTPILFNEHFYVAPAYRGSRLALALIQVARDLALENDFGLEMHISFAKDAEVKDRLLSKLGGKYLGGRFKFV